MHGDVSLVKVINVKVLGHFLPQPSHLFDIGGGARQDHLIDLVAAKDQEIRRFPTTRVGA
jgi:hypothetical protein